MAYPTEIVGILGIWSALFLMLMIYSYPLYKENPFFRFAEHLFIGLALAIAVITAIQTTIKMAVTPLLSGNIVYVIPIILGFMMYFIFSSDYRWVSRYPIAILVGSAIGLGMRGVIIPNILTQIVSTITFPKSTDFMSMFNFVYIALGTLFAVMYFLLTYEHKGAILYPTRLGRWLIMIGLGAYYGNTVLFRMSMLSGRAQYLLQVLRIIPM
ncbi:hypothetical protein KEJ21_04995 [Candidatus Bathyarchaeota archaeon]|nr:hypothetical protein [Candidatus Bathyarchaeota archaeon]